MMKTLGILGGMGPLASAEFVDTIYRLNVVEPEQEAPICLLHSDPSFPDRTEAILAGDTEPLAVLLAQALAKLAAMGADRIIIACVTIHQLLPQVAEPLRERVVSLVDLALDEVLRNPRPLLLMATRGTRAGRIFESHERWELAKSWVRVLEEPDQRRFHDWVYLVKANHPVEEGIEWLDTLSSKYGTAGYLCGCTELHILVKALQRRTGYFDPRFIDPLLLVAQALPTLLAA